MKARGKMVVVEQHVSELQSKGGIILPSDTQKPLPRGTVKFVGPDVQGLVPGNIVCFNEFAGSLINVKDQPYKVMEESDVLVVLEEGDLN